MIRYGNRFRRDKNVNNTRQFKTANTFVVLNSSYDKQSTQKSIDTHTHTSTLYIRQSIFYQQIVYLF